ncbi:MAG: hypothetical protein QOE46_2226 [Acidobacteriota bacterium]|jgi:uncharacterized protein (DUF1800 family)|nr:hypothetical protein [Acidobacteriota bacterium]
MKEHLFLLVSSRAVRLVCVCALLVAVHASSAWAQSPAGSPVLLTEGTGTTTRGVAYEAVTSRSEPFPVTSSVNWNADKSNTRDQRTRIMLFAMSLALLPGEGANALTADAQDSAGRVYPLKVEALSPPKYVQLQPAPDNPNLQVPTEVAQSWLYSVTLRLDDSMTDTLGDVLVRINLHGLSSNRVRVAIGQAAAGIATDPSTEILSPAPPTAPAPTPTPTPKAFGPGETTTADATRLLEQATWGPTSSEVARVQGIGLRAFIDEQFAAPVLNPSKGSEFPDLAFPLDDTTQGCPTGSAGQADCLRDNYSIYPVQKQFFSNALTRPAQLRQRVAFALHQIFVVSNRDIPYPSWMTPYLQSLDRNAFGSYRTLLGEMTLNPAMGEYLDMRRSVNGNANENYAREVLQLFSVGVNQLNADGTPVLDSQGSPVPTYSQATVNEFTRVFTGWNLAATFQSGTTNYRDQMIPRNSTTHDTGAKTLFSTSLTGCVGASGAANGACAQNELNAALDVIANHSNTAPFISKQLIQHLVTSNPSPAYVQRVASAFNDDCNGLYPESPCTHARGSLKAVVRNILLDPEARGDLKTDPNYGKLREPVQYLNNILRAFNATSDGVLGTRSSGGDMPGSLDQPVYQPTTVFSYYVPDYEAPGARLLGPAFQILSTSTTLRRANIANQLIYTGIPVGTNNPGGTQLDFTALDSLASGDGSQLVDRLNTLLLHGTMSQPMRTAIMTAVQSINASSPRSRVQTAVYLVVTSPQYDVQR